MHIVLHIRISTYMTYTRNNVCECVLTPVVDKKSFSNFKKIAQSWADVYISYGKVLIASARIVYIHIVICEIILVICFFY